MAEHDSGKSPRDPVNHLMKAMNDFFQHRPGKGFLDSMDELFTSTPFNSSFSVELNENEREYIVQAKLPGINKEQIEIDVIQQHITITVQQNQTILNENNKKEQVHRAETYKQLSRTIPLTRAINAHKVSAIYENGLLTVTIPKVKGKKIDIK
ncbi:Hsp20/alpha crystallin family protein [Bacillus sp. FSL K6-3431]|uniref:Hsp20/alpha crystallin family protein n=1 Tax=Bacillus sp. FSL K6-3431 TaxID=2921500 RepID=UPI0030FD1FA6